MEFSPLAKTMSITATVQFTASNVLWTRRKAIDSMLPQRPPPQCANNTSTGGGGEGYISPSNTSSPLWKLQRKGGGEVGLKRVLDVLTLPSRGHEQFQGILEMGRRKEEEDDEDPIFSFFFFAERKGGFLEGKGGAANKKQSQIRASLFSLPLPPHRATCTRRKSDLVFVP